jgi:Protein of unknown function (DUF3197)
MKNPSMDTTEPVGLQGAPLETLEAVKVALRTVELRGAIVTLIADWQDRRDSARYAVFVRHGERSVLSEDAFGGRYGAAGVKALADLVTMLWDRGAENFKESIIAPHDFARLLEHPTPEHLGRVTASANPTDPEIYR